MFGENIFFRFYPDQLLLCYFKTKEDAIKKKFQGKINIGWMWTETISEEDGLVKKQLKSTTNVCTQRFTLFCPKRIYVLSAETDEICTEWIKEIQCSIDKFTLGEEREEKVEASKELEPLLNKILKIQMDQVELMLNALKESGLFITDSSKKLKEGHLDIKKQDDTWKTYYVVLWKDCLSYFDAESKSTARGFISTESIISLKCEEFKFPSNTSKLDQKQKDKIEEEKKRGTRRFKLVTPLRTYQYKAKHKEAMVDWLLAIQNVSPSLSKIIERTSSKIEAPSVRGKKDFSHIQKCEKQIERNQTFSRQI